MRQYAIAIANQQREKIELQLREYLASESSTRLASGRGSRCKRCAAPTESSCLNNTCFNKQKLLPYRENIRGGQNFAPWMYAWPFNSKPRR